MAVTDGAVTGGYLKEFETPELPTYSVCFIGPWKEKVVTKIDIS